MLMNTLRSYLVHVVTVGVIVTLLLSLVLYWARFACKSVLGGITPLANRRAQVQPCGLLPLSLETQPAVVVPSRVMVDVHPEETVPLNEHTDLWLIGVQTLEDEKRLYTYFDPAIGKIVQCKIYQEEDEDGESNGLWINEPQLFVGPEGISVIDSDETGRFVEPRAVFDGKEDLIILDTKLRRLFRVNLAARQVVEAPAESLAEMGAPVAAGRISKNPNLLSMQWTPPLREATEQERRTRQDEIVPGNFIPAVPLSINAGEYVLVLDNAGRLHKLNRQTLQWAGQTGYLPTAPEFAMSRDEMARPYDLPAWIAVSVSFDPNNTYLGALVATLSPDGTGATVAVFDADGEMVASDMTMATRVRRRFERENGPRVRDLSDAEADTGYGKQLPGGSGARAGGPLDDDTVARARTINTYFEMPGGPALTGLRYLLENLQPPVFSVASYFTAPYISPEKGQRNLLLLPHSFAGSLGRKYQEDRFQRLAVLAMTMSPSLLIAAVLTMAVRRQARTIGLSDRSIKYWTAAILTFGLPAFLTWRFTRPTHTLVTCANCGRGRRPDMEKCHHCGSAWEVPELLAPAWRVFDDHAASSGASVPSTVSTSLQVAEEQPKDDNPQAQTTDAQPSA
jgi:hypothetical protein